MSGKLMKNRKKRSKKEAKGSITIRDLKPSKDVTAGDKHKPWIELGTGINPYLKLKRCKRSRSCAPDHVVGSVFCAFRRNLDRDLGQNTLN